MENKRGQLAYVAINCNYFNLFIINVIKTRSCIFFIMEAKLFQLPAVKNKKRMSKRIQLKLMK